MIKWKLFGKNKQKTQEMEISNPIIKDETTIEQNKEDILKVADKPEEEIREYNETLYTCDHPSHKKDVIHTHRSWDSTSTIEKNVDEIDKKKEIYKATSSGSDRLEKKVDQLLRSKGITSSQKKK